MTSASGVQGAMAPFQRGNSHQVLLQRRSKTVRARRRVEYAIGALMAALVMAALVAAWVFYAELMLSPPADPGPNSFAETRRGKVVVPVNGMTCREYSLDNETGSFGADKRVRCEDGKISGSPPGMNASFESYKRAFGKK